MMTILIFSSGNIFLECACLVKTRNLLPHTPLWESLFFGTSSLVHYHQMDGKLQAYDFFETAHLENDFTTLYLFFFLLTLNQQMVQAFAYGQTYKNSSMQRLVHRDCH
jgi:hypothetical protein